MNLFNLLCATRLVCGTSRAPQLYEEFLELRGSYLRKPLPPILTGQKLGLDLMYEAGEKAEYIVSNEPNLQIKTMVLRVPSFFIAGLYRFKAPPFPLQFPLSLMLL